MKIDILACYTTQCQLQPKFPEGKGMDDIKDILIKWDNCLIQFNDGTSMEMKINEDDCNTDWKRPHQITAYDFENKVEKQFE